MLCDCLSNLLLVDVLQSELGRCDLGFQSFEPSDARLAGEDVGLHCVELLFAAIVKQETLQDLFGWVFEICISHMDGLIGVSFSEEYVLSPRMNSHKKGSSSLLGAVLPCPRVLKY